jgi:hypothetical protein
VDSARAAIIEGISAEEYATLIALLERIADNCASLS